MVHTRTSSILLPSPSSSSASYSSRQHIRFAPLPDPRYDTTTSPRYSAEECDPDPPTEDILVSSSSSSSSSSQLSSSTTSTPHISCDLDKSSPDSSVGSSPVTPLTALPQKFPPTTHDSPVPPSPQVSWVKKPHISLFRPFKRFSTSSSGSSSHTLTPTPSIDTSRRRSITKEDVLTLGTVNLFRTTSRESSRNSRDDDSLWSLSRWSSRSSNIPGSSSPSLRNQSNQSLVSQSSSRFPSSSSSSSSDSKTKPKVKPPPVGQQPRTNKYKGTRMLNGRVYGAPKRNANPFANARDEEPEFVEWGYGGMGSVKGAKSAGVGSNWDRLQSGSIDVGVGGVGAGIGAGDAELDDGSGLAWVKRRREERERKAREQKEKEETELAESESQTNTPIPTRSPTVESLPTLASPLSAIESATHTAPTIDIPPLTVVLENEEGETATQANFATPKYPSELGISATLQTEDGQSKAEEGHLHNTHENERVLQAITIPVRSPRHHHHRQLSKGGSREVLVPPSTDGPGALVQIVESPSTTGGDTTDAPTNASHTSTMEHDKSTSSSSESESEFEGGFDDDDSDDEEEEQESPKQIGSRKSALGTAAGVEKISRHKE